MQNITEKLIHLNKKVGFVPTMGYFHDGHLSLMKQARRENEIVIASIFVNPLQFGPEEDYDRYPQDEKRDIALAEQLGVDFLFMPSVDEMYPTKMIINMSISGRVDELCGKSRPGHFDGVITVLTKLFHIIQPDKVYFGLKDAQQVAVIDALVSDLNFPIKIIGLPTVRESDGLAMSSRNINLTKDERNQAIYLYHSLKLGQQLIVDGERNPVIIKKEMTNHLKKNLQVSIDYVEILEFPTLKTISAIDKHQQVIIAVAVLFKQARLIDNLILNKEGQIRVRLD